MRAFLRAFRSEVLRVSFFVDQVATIASLLNDLLDQVVHRPTSGGGLDRLATRGAELRFLVVFLTKGKFLEAFFAKDVSARMDSLYVEKHTPHFKREDKDSFVFEIEILDFLVGGLEGILERECLEVILRSLFFFKIFNPKFS